MTKIALDRNFRQYFAIADIHFDHMEAARQELHYRVGLVVGDALCNAPGISHVIAVDIDHKEEWYDDHRPPLQYLEARITFSGITERHLHHDLYPRIEAAPTCKVAQTACRELWSRAKRLFSRTRKCR